MQRRFYSRHLLKEIELKWRSKPKPKEELKLEQKSPDSYILAMFPYPSGALHMGHVRVYSISDCLARHAQIKCKNGVHKQEVLHPMGWDAFGLPAENAALAASVQPRTWTENNISQMKTQLIDLGYNFTWNAELKTCSPDYYRWTQWLFLQMYKMGLAYRKEAPVSWDPVDGTVLAAEQVDSNGRSWRSGAIVEQKMLTQWYWKITDYAEDLIAGLDNLEWPEAVKEMQRNWIGRSEGALIEFPIKDDFRKIKGIIL